ncbi:MAG: ThuA domain-containing protein [Akkermansiaceae bacterium]
MKVRLIGPLAIVLFALGIPTLAQRGKGNSSQPNEPLPKSEVLKITGKLEDKKLSRDINILWLYGPEDHRGGEHDYIRIKEMFVPLLKTIPRVTVAEAFQFPTQKQFDQADLLIQYLHLPDLTDEQFAMYQKFVDQGNGVVSIHESCIMRPVKSAKKWASCIGASWKGNRTSKWSKFNHDHSVYLDTRHEAFKGLPHSIQLNDESYWNLLKRENVKVIGAIAPTGNHQFKDLLGKEGTRSDTFWTYQSGKGRVFGTTTGHFTYTFHDPIYRLLLLRGMAWAINEDPAPFLPLVFQGITDEKDLVGTTDPMMDYQNRKR